MNLKAGDEIEFTISQTHWWGWWPEPYWRFDGSDENEAKDRIKKTDKSRASYYNYYSAKDWGDAKSYDLCIDSSLLGIDGTVELLKDLIRIKDIK